MKDSTIGDRMLRKLERLVDRPLAGVAPRIFKALGIDRLEDQWSRSSGEASRSDIDKQQRISGCSLQETTPRLRRELGL